MEPAKEIKTKVVVREEESLGRATASEMAKADPKTEQELEEIMAANQIVS